MPVVCRTTISTDCLVLTDRSFEPPSSHHTGSHLQKLFKEIFLAHSNSTARLELLAHCFSVGKADLPSWVPDRCSCGDNDVPSVPTSTTLTAGMSKANFKNVQDGVLEVSGVIHGAATSTYSAFDCEKGDLVGPWLRQLIKECTTSALYPTGKDIHISIAKLLCRCQLQERFPEAYH